MSKRILLIGNGVNLVASCNEKLKNDGLCERFPQPEEAADNQEKRPNNEFFALFYDQTSIKYDCFSVYNA